MSGVFLFNNATFIYFRGLLFPTATIISQLFLFPSVIFKCMGRGYLTVSGQSNSAWTALNHWICNTGGWKDSSLNGRCLLFIVWVRKKASLNNWERLLTAGGMVTQRLLRPPPPPGAVTSASRLAHVPQRHEQREVARSTPLPLRVSRIRPGATRRYPQSL